MNTRSTGRVPGEAGNGIYRGLGAWGAKANRTLTYPGGYSNWPAALFR